MKMHDKLILLKKCVAVNFYLRNALQMILAYEFFFIIYFIYTHIYIYIGWIFETKWSDTNQGPHMTE